jgi:dihydroorotate dehydrogenase electron transfer subunit
MDFLQTRVTAVERPAPAHVLIRFAGERPITGEPGQFVMVRGDWGTHPVLARAFSLVESGADGAILVRVVGQGTALLEAARVGDTLFVLGPRGRGYSTPTADRRVVLVAGGIGVAPLIFMAERLAAAGSPPTFLFGARSSPDLPLRERVAAASSELSITTEDGSVGERGLIISPLARVLGSGEPVQIFACGPEGMLEAVARLAVAAEAPCEVALESPMACGMGTCKGCAVLAADREYRYVCSDGPVFESTEIYGGAR